ncbi:MAG: hypothetical protein V1735_06865 [Nanoarchaeota archaeon]
MIPVLLYFWILLAFAALSFLEVAIEGKHPWATASPGWRRNLLGNYELTAYHLWLYIMLIVYLTMPFVILGWSVQLFGLILSAAVMGFVIEDFLWFVVNPYFPLSNFNSIEVDWYPWLKLFGFEIPWMYVGGVILSFLALFVFVF